jgi:hypothetical protein
MPSIRDTEPAFLVAAARAAVARSNIRAVATEAGLSHGGLGKLLSGTTQWIYGSTFKKLRVWFWSQWADHRGALTPDTAHYVFDQLLVPLDPDQRADALTVLVRTVEELFDRGSTPRPAWLVALGSAASANGNAHAG